MIIRVPEDTHKQLTRDMPREQYWQSEARELLRVLLVQNPDFKSESCRVRAEFPQFKWRHLREIMRYDSGHFIGWWDETGCWVTRPRLDEKDEAVQYCKEIESLTHRFGLRSKWGPELIHHLVSLPGIQPVETWWMGDEIITITLQVEISPGTKWGDVKGGILKEAKSQFQAKVKPLRDATGFPERDRGPDNLERDVGLLYQRICLGMGDLAIWNAWEREHEDDEALTYERVREIISNTARLLGIAL
jgi:hypothetical protein